MRPIVCPETSVRNYHNLLRNNPGELSPQINEWKNEWLYNSTSPCTVFERTRTTLPLASLTLHCWVKKRIIWVPCRNGYINTDPIKFNDFWVWLNNFSLSAHLIGPRCTYCVFSKSFIVDFVWNVMAHTQKPDFVFRAKRTSPFKSAGGVSSVDYCQPRCARQR